MKSCVTGSVLSVILTILPYLAVKTNFFGPRVIVLWIILFSTVAQILVHFVYFLYMQIKINESWIFITLVFTMTVISVLVVGSIWIMSNLNHNIMMPS